jgi:voltage-gated potassium channel
MKSPLRRILWVLALMSSLLTFGTLAFRWIEGWTFFDAFYMTLMTLTTVGYGEVHPLSPAGRLIASALMMGGVATVFISIGVLVDTIIKLELADTLGRKRRHHMIEKLTGHYIVCGAGRVGRRPTV